MSEFKNAVNPVKDDVIKKYDVCKVVASNEIILVEEGIKEFHKTKGLTAVNSIIGLKDWLNVYPDGELEILGNASISVGN